MTQFIKFLGEREDMNLSEYFVNSNKCDATSQVVCILTRLSCSLPHITHKYSGTSGSLCHLQV